VSEADDGRGSFSDGDALADTVLFQEGSPALAHASTAPVRV
jgi:hypothetical protein